MPAMAAESRPSRTLNLHEERVRRAPVQRLAWLGEQLLPQAIGKIFKMLVLFFSSGEVEDDCSVRLQTAHHRQAEREETTEFSDLWLRMPNGGRVRKSLEGQLQIENEAKEVEAVTRGVEAKEEQFIVRRKLPAVLSLKDGWPRPLQCAFDVEVESQRVFHVVVQLDRGSPPVPGTMVVVGHARDESNRGEDGFGARQIGFADQEVEVAADPQCGVQVEPLSKEGPFERYGQNV